MSTRPKHESVFAEQMEFFAANSLDVFRLCLTQNNLTQEKEFKELCFPIYVALDKDQTKILFSDAPKKSI